MLVHWQAVSSATYGVVLVLLAAVIALPGCGGDPYPVDSEPFERMAAELDRRSFRKFRPSVDESPRSGVILDFHDGLSIWAQYSESGHAVNEWEITADGYRIEWTGDASEIVLFPVGVASMRQFPDPCSDCIPTSGVSISVRNILDATTLRSGSTTRTTSSHRRFRCSIPGPVSTRTNTSSDGCRVHDARTQRVLNVNGVPVSTPAVQLT